MPENPSRLFRTNQDVKIEDCDAVVEGYSSLSNVNIRIKNFMTITKVCGSYLKQLQCLTPNGEHSRIYIISEKELVRQQHGQEGKTSEYSKKRTKSKR